MMHLPWVSRALYEESQRQAAELKEERRALLNRLAEKAGFRPLYEEPVSQSASQLGGGDSAAAPPSEVSTATQPAPARMRATIDDVETWANNELRKRAEE